MTYDYHGKWEDFTGHNSPLFAHSQERDEAATLNVVSNYRVDRKNRSLQYISTIKHIEETRENIKAIKYEIYSKNKYQYSILFY